MLNQFCYFCNNYTPDLPVYQISYKISTNQTGYVGVFGAYRVVDVGLKRNNYAVDTSKPNQHELITVPHAEASLDSIIYGYTVCVYGEEGKGVRRRVGKKIVWPFDFYTNSYVKGGKGERLITIDMIRRKVKVTLKAIVKVEVKGKIEN